MKALNRLSCQAQQRKRSSGLQEQKQSASQQQKSAWVCVLITLAGSYAVHRLMWCHSWVQFQQLLHWTLWTLQIQSQWTTWHKKLLCHIGQQKSINRLEGDIIKNGLSACWYFYLHFGCVTTKPGTWLSFLLFKTEESSASIHSGGLTAHFIPL